MSALPAPARWRATAWLVIAALLLPSLLACTTAPYPPPSGSSVPTPPPAREAAIVARLDGIVADGNRAVPGREPGLVFVTQGGVVRDGAAGLELHLGDRVETGPRAHAVIRYPSGTELLLRPNSGGTIGSLTDFVGEVFVKVRGLFSVDTTFVKAGARGTAYLVRTYAGGTTGVTVVDGVVEVGSTTGAWPSMALGAGTTTLAHPRGPQPMAANVDDLARTREWVERVEQLVPSPRGVSTGTVVGAVAIGAVIAALIASRDHERERSGDAPRPPTHETTPPPRDPAAPPQRLDAPRGTEPGSAQRPGPTLDCRRGVMLRWSAVAGAHDYAVTMEVQRERGWSAQRIAPTGATQTSVAAQSLGNENRWSVRARAAYDGPPSQSLNFRCDFSGVR